MTYNELQEIADAVEFADYRLNKDGVYTSQENWDKMMRLLDRAAAIIAKARAARSPMTFHNILDGKED